MYRSIPHQLRASLSTAYSLGAVAVVVLFDVEIVLEADVLALVCDAEDEADVEAEVEALVDIVQGAICLEAFRFRLLRQ